MKLGFLVVSSWIAALAGCGEARDEPLSVVDSAGVRHTISPDRTRVFARVDPTPSVSIGGSDVSGPGQFYRVQAIHVGREGNLWVADGNSGEVRIFHPDGSYWKTRGGIGEGPGEFRRIRLLGPFHGDSVAFWDDGNPRLTVFDPTGEFSRTARVEWGGSPPPHALGVFSDGTILAKKPVLIPVGTLNPGQVFGDTVSLVRGDLADQSETVLGLAPGPLWVFTGTNQVPIPFTINAPFLLRRDEVHVCAGPAFRIQVIEGGSIVEEYGVDRDPREVTPAEILAYVDLYEQYIPDPAQRREYLSTVDHPARPDHLPSYDRMIAGGDGNVWAQIYEPDLSGRTWEVYGGNREWLGQVEVPEGFMLLAVSEGSLVGVWRDELGVEYVRVFRLVSN